MLNREIMGVYCGNYITQTQWQRKMQFLVLNLTVHILTTRLNVVTMRNAVPVPINYSPSARRKQTRRIGTRRIQTAFHTLQALDPSALAGTFSFQVRNAAMQRNPHISQTRA